MRALLVISAATLMILMACNRYAAYYEEQMRWAARDYHPVVATVENGGLRAIAVADSVMVTLGYDLSAYTSLLSMDSTTFRIEYPYRESIYKDTDGGTVIRLGGGITTFQGQTSLYCSSIRARSIL